MKCLICDETNPENSQKCKCGWDISSDFTVHPTINPLSNEQLSVFRDKVVSARTSFERTRNAAQPSNILPEISGRETTPSLKLSTDKGGFNWLLKLFCFIFVPLWSYLLFNKIILLFVNIDYVMVFAVILAAIAQLYLFIDTVKYVLNREVMNSVKFYVCCSPLMFYLAATSMYSRISFYNLDSFNIILTNEIYIIILTTLVIIINSILIFWLPSERIFQKENHGIFASVISFLLICSFGFSMGLAINLPSDPVKNIYLSNIHRSIFVNESIDFGAYDGIVRDALGLDDNVVITQYHLLYVQQLELNGTSSFDTSVLRFFPNLIRLNIEDVNNVNISEKLPTRLSYLTLKNVGLDESDLIYIDPKGLEQLNLSDNSISEISNLSNFLSLRELNLSNNYIVDIFPLSKLVKLERLNLSNNLIIDIDSLAKLERLKYLNLYRNAIKNGEPLSQLEDLETLYIGDNSDLNYSYILELDIPNVYLWGE